MRKLRFKKLRRPHFITEETWEAGVGPVNLDVRHARSAGWSEKQIQRAYDQLAKISSREFRIAHRNGPVKGCVCVVCDPRVSDDMTDAPEVRARWMRLGIHRAKGSWFGKLPPK